MRALKRMVLRMVSLPRAATAIAWGGLVFLVTRRTPVNAYMGMLQLFTATGGKSNDMLARILALCHRPYSLPNASGVLGSLTDADVTRINAELQARGYHVFEQRLSPDICDKLLDFALTQPALIRLDDEGARAGKVASIAVYDRMSPKGIRYDFDQEILVNNPDVQRLMCDLSIIAVAQAYLGTKPILDSVNLWWTAPSRCPDSEAAQLYHFDLDRIRWLKFFVYINDVGPSNGPHCFISGSHRAGGIPPHLLSRGYARIPDEEVAACYSSDDLLEFTGPRGTILAEDTRGLHKGKAVTAGDRLIFEFEFSNSLFGGTKAEKRLSMFHSEAFEQFVNAHPRMYSRWLK